jgi:hypothetical protein
MTAEKKKGFTFIDMKEAEEVIAFYKTLYPDNIHVSRWVARRLGVPMPPDRLLSDDELVEKEP